MQCQCHSVWVLLSVATIALVACAKDPAPDPAAGTQPNPPITPVQTPEPDASNYELVVPATLAQGLSTPVSVLTKGEAAVAKDVTWSVKEGGTGQVEIKQEGSNTVVSANGVGEVTLVATLKVDGKTLNKEIKLVVGPPLVNPRLVIDAPESGVVGVETPVSAHVENVTSPQAATWVVDAGSTGAGTFTTADSATFFKPSGVGDVTLVATAVVSGVTLEARKSIRVLVIESALITLQPQPSLTKGNTVHVKAELLLTDKLLQVHETYTGVSSWDWRLVNEPTNTLSKITPTGKGTEGTADVYLGHAGTITIQATAHYGRTNELTYLSPVFSLNPIQGPILTGITLDGVYNTLLALGERINVFVTAIYSDRSTERVAAQWKVNGQAVNVPNTLGVTATSGDLTNGINIAATYDTFSAAKTIQVQTPQAIDLAVLPAVPLKLEVSNGANNASNRWLRSFDISTGVPNSEMTLAIDLAPLANGIYQYEIDMAPTGDDYKQFLVCKNVGTQLDKIGCGGVTDIDGKIHGLINITGQVDSSPLELAYKVYTGRYRSEGKYDPVNNVWSPKRIFDNNVNEYTGEVMANQTDASNSISYYDASFAVTSAGSVKIDYTIVQQAPLSTKDTISMEIAETKDFAARKCIAQPALGGASKAATCTVDWAVGGTANKNVYIRVNGLPNGGGAVAAGGASFCLYQQVVQAGTPNVLPTTCTARVLQ